MKMFLYTICLLTVVIFSSFAQKPPKSFLIEINKDKNQLKQFNIAQTHFDEANFADALEEFLNLQHEYPDQIYYDFMVGVNYVLVGENYEEAAKLLEKVKLTNPTLEDLEYYLGKAYQLNGDYSKAVQSFNNYLKTNPKKDKELRTRRSIEECENAANNNTPNTEIRIENLGNPINTAASEYVPLISSDESVLIFTYRGERSKGGKQNEFFEPDPYGHYYEDIFISYRLGDNWLEPEGISEKINTKGHDACVGLSADGQRLFIFKSTAKDGGDLYESFFDGNDWSEPKNLGPIINSKYWEGSCSLSADGQTLYFSSDRPGGFGGKDLYKSILLPNGSWSKPINLGATINTKYDEDSPFIHPDGETFYFSSKGHNTLGGYDIYKSQITHDAFTTPENIGPPINTGGDDIYYVVNANGLVGYYSSGRNGGLGLQDIYRVKPGITGKLPVLLLFKGTTTHKGNVIATNIKITDITQNRSVGNYQTNAVTGKFLISLNAGSEYALEIAAAATPTIKQIINLKNLDQFIETVVDIDLDKLSKDGETFIQSKIEEQVEADKKEKKINKDLTAKKESNTGNIEQDKQNQQSIFLTSLLFKDLQNNYGDKTFEEATFKIEHNQLNEQNETVLNILKTEPGYSELIDSKGNKHYQIGKFSTINQAMEKRQILMQKQPALSNSFIVAETPQGIIPIKQFLSEEMKNSLVANTATSKSNEIKSERANPTNNAISNNKTSPPPASDAYFENRQQSQLNYMSSNSYEQILIKYGNYSKPKLSFIVEIISDQSYNSATYQALEKFEKPNELKDERGNIHHHTKTFNTLGEANEYRKKLMEENPELGNSFVAVYDGENLRTVKDYFKETMLAQMGISPREEETKNNLKIVSINDKPISKEAEVVLAENVKQENKAESLTINANENKNTTTVNTISNKTEDKSEPTTQPKTTNETTEKETLAIEPTLKEENQQKISEAPSNETEKTPNAFKANNEIIASNAEPQKEIAITDQTNKTDEIKNTDSNTPINQTEHTTTQKTDLTTNLTQEPKNEATSNTSKSVEESQNLANNNEKPKEELDEEMKSKQQSLQENNTTSTELAEKSTLNSNEVNTITENKSQTMAQAQTTVKEQNSKELTQNNSNNTNPTNTKSKPGNENKKLSKSTTADPTTLAYYINKDLNNPLYYNQLVENFGRTTKSNLIFKVQIGAYRFPQNFKYEHVKSFGEVSVTPYEDGITRFTQLEHNSLYEAEQFRQTLIKAGIKDAWVTVFYNGKRLLMQEAIKQGLLAESDVN